MNVLALDCSTELCSVALLVDGRLYTDTRVAGQTHSQLLLPMVDALLAEAELAVGRLDGLAFGAGPGSFTGIRIACGVAQGIALGTGLPLVPVGTLAAMAEQCDAARVLCCLDARMHEIYHACFERDADGMRALEAPALSRPDALPPPEGTGWVGCGNGFAAYRAALTARLGGALADVRPEILPRAAEMARIAARALARGEGVAPEQALPVYVRDKVALTVAEQR